MVAPPDKIARRSDFGPVLNRMLDELIADRNDVVARLQEVEASAGPDTDYIVNNGSGVMLLGSVFGFDSDGKVTQAVATSGSAIWPHAVCVASTGSGAQMEFASSHTWECRLEADTMDPKAGTPAWLSGTVAGTVTNVKPTAPAWSLFIGPFAKTKNLDNGLIAVTLLIVPLPTR
jgi:hypothetical protein